MKYTLYLNQNQISDLEFEVISTPLKVHITRLLSQQIKSQSQSEWAIVSQNALINKARNLVGLPIYALEADDMGEYHPAEYAWHNGEFELLFRRFNTSEAIEFLGVLIEEDYFSVKVINELLEREGASFHFDGALEDKISVVVTSLENLSTEQEDQGHPNIRVLIRRMDDALQRTDVAGVILTSASIFETLAKDIVGIASIQDQTLKSFFARYRRDSSLPDEILDYVLRIYDARSTTPLAGHGSTQTPEISKEQAIVLSEMTKAFVKIEYRLSTVVSRET